MVGALQRAGAWHGAVLTLVTTATAAPLPAWLAALQLRAELLRARDICECHGLSEVSARRGDIGFLICSSTYNYHRYCSTCRPSCRGAATSAST